MSPIGGSLSSYYNYVETARENSDRGIQINSIRTSLSKNNFMSPVRGGKVTVFSPASIKTTKPLV